jgi:hypothetical protein
VKRRRDEAAAKGGEMSGMLEKATAQKELFVSRGMSPMLLDALAGALGEFEKTLEASREGRRNHVGASADLKAVAAEIKEQVRVLDGLRPKRRGAVAWLAAAPCCNCDLLDACLR